ncbi:hypothetical protein C0416_02935 [bacterium]|nr:hypothetical protein [bacterium]
MNEELVELLRENNKLLAELVMYQRKEERAQKWHLFFQIFFHLLPFIIIALLGWWVFNLINSNIQALQGNVNALKDFVVGIVPDFSGVGDKLNSVWQDVTFWD